MINFIIYEKDKKFRNQYISIILKLIGNKNIAYEIIEIDKYNDKVLDDIIGKKIFILDIEVPGLSGFDLAKRIRKSGDWNSPIIIVTTHEKLEYITLKSKLLILDYISKYLECSEKLYDSLLVAMKIVEKESSLKFLYNGEIHQIPYQDILYIEKDDITIIHTKRSNIEINKTINQLEKLLEHDNRFFRTHRSCIVNLDNISSFELSDSSIRFNKKKINLITKDKKKELKELLLKS